MSMIQAINSALEILELRSVDDTDRRVVQAALRFNVSQPAITH